MSERLNIKNMLVEPEPIPEKPFDPARDISSNDRQEMRAGLDKERMGRDYCEYVMSLAILGEDVAFANSKLEEQLYFHPATLNPFQVTARLAALALIGHKPFRSLTDIEKVRTQKNLAYTVKDLAIIKEDPSLTNTDWDNMRTRLEKYKADEEWDHFAIQAAAMAILGQKPECTPSDWDHMNKDLDRLRTHEIWHRFAQIGASMAVLAADEIVIPEDGGLQLLNDNKLPSSEGVPSLPNLRKF